MKKGQKAAQGFQSDGGEHKPPTVGYDNVEHFNRLFKKIYGLTPVQFRRESR